MRFAVLLVLLVGCANTVTVFRDPAEVPEGCVRRTRDVDGRSVGYAFCPSPLSWSEAVDACAATGAQLVRVESGDENVWVFETARGIDGAQAWWIGATDQDDEGTWTDPDGNPLDFQRWAAGEPNSETEGEDCAEVNNDSAVDDGWNDRTCNLSQPFVCKL